MLADALASNVSMLSLDLSSNRIGNAGAIALAAALHFNSTLVDLQLGGNHIGVCVGIYLTTHVSCMHLSVLCPVLNPMNAACVCICRR